MATKNKQACPTCGQSVNERQITIGKNLAQALLRVLRWCLEKGVHEFKMQDIRHLFGHTEYCTFGQWTKFGGIVYRPRNKPKNGNYGIHTGRALKFFRNEWPIPAAVWHNPLDGTNRKEGQVLYQGLPNLKDFLDESNQFVVTYGPQIESLRTPDEDQMLFD